MLMLESTSTSKTQSKNYVGICTHAMKIRFRFTTGPKCSIYPLTASTGSFHLI